MFSFSYDTVKPIQNKAVLPENSAPIRSAWERLFDNQDFQVFNCTDSDIEIHMFVRDKKLERLSETGVTLKVGVEAVEGSFSKKAEYDVDLHGKPSLLQKGVVLGKGLAMNCDDRRRTFAIDKGTRIYLVVIQIGTGKHFIQALSYRHRAYLVKNKHFNVQCPDTSPEVILDNMVGQNKELSLDTPVESKSSASFPESPRLPHRQSGRAVMASPSGSRSPSPAHTVSIEFLSPVPRLNRRK